MRTYIESIRKCGRGRGDREVIIRNPNCVIRCKPADLESAELFAKAMHRHQGRRPAGPAWGEVSDAYGGYLTRGVADRKFKELVDKAARI